MEEQLQLKKRLHKLCEAQIEERLEVIKDRLSLVQESKANETKSSVGDKYETGRAMLQIEEQNIKVQEAKILEDKSRLDVIQHDAIKTMVTDGALVETNQLNFYISIALGKMKLDGRLYYCISKQSPIGKKNIW